MMIRLKDEHREALSKLDSEGRLRRLSSTVDAPQDKIISIDGRSLVNFSSNNYLSLAAHPEVIEAMRDGTRRYGAGSSASRLVSGDMAPHRKLEHRVTDFLGASEGFSTLLFNSGYHANTGVIPTLVSRGDEILADRLVHASIIDGALLSRATLRRFPHCDLDALESLLASSTAKKKLVVTEGVFSMEGTVPPLVDIFRLAERYGAIVYLDDAHGFGVLGRGGRGAIELFDLAQKSNLIYMATLGKAIGTYGAFVHTDVETIEYLLNRARTFVFSTSLPPGVCEAGCKALDLAANEAWRRERVKENGAYLRERLSSPGKNVLSGSSHIVPLLVGDDEASVDTSRVLGERGYFVQAIRPPTVPEGTSRLRLTVTAEHTKEDIDGLVNAISDFFQT